MYLLLKEENFLLRQPDGMYFSYILNGVRMLLGVNESGEHILRKLTGQFSEIDIVESLVEHYSDSYDIVEKLVNDFLIELKTNNLILESRKPSNRNVIMGSRKFYTPEHVTLELTHKCPLRCKHCFVNAGVGSEMSQQEHERIVEDLLNIGVRTFQLTGGEPFTFKDITTTIKMLQEKMASIHISTSGYILNKNVKNSLEKLSQSIDPLVQVSIDGLEHTHNGIRGKNDAYTKSVSFIKYCISKGIPTIVSTVLISQSLEEMEKLTLIVKKLGVQELRLGLITNQGRAEDNNIKGFNYKQYKETLCHLKTRYDDENFKVEQIEDESNCLKECGAGYKTIKITPKMTITLCAMMQLNIGNLKNESLETILTRSYKNFSQLEFPQKKYCFDCSEADYCNDCISESIVRKSNVKRCAWEDSQKDILCKLI